MHNISFFSAHCTSHNCTYWALIRMDSNCWFCTLQEIRFQYSFSTTLYICFAQYFIFVLHTAHRTIAHIGCWSGFGNRVIVVVMVSWGPVRSISWYYWYWYCFYSISWYYCHCYSFYSLSWYYCFASRCEPISLFCVISRYFLYHYWCCYCCLYGK